MTKIAKRIMLVFSSFLFVVCLSVGGLLGLNTNKNVTAKAATDITFNSIAWNNIDYAYEYAPTGTLLLYNGGQYVITDENTNLTAELGDKITIDGKPISEMQLTASPDVLVESRPVTNGNAYLLIRYEAACAKEGAVLHFQEATAGKANFPELQFVFTNGAWVKTATPANYLGIADGYNMTDVVSNGRLSLGLQFDKPLSASANTNLFDGNTLNMYLDGVQLANGNFSPRCYSDIQDYTIMQLLFKNALGSEGTYAAGVKLQNGTKLEIKDSIVNGYALPNITLYFNGTTWQETDPTIASYVGIVEGYEWILHSTDRRAVVVEFDKPINPNDSGNISELDGTSGNIVNVTLNGNARNKSNLLARSRVVATNNSNAIEFVFKGYETAGTVYAEGVTSPFADGTKLEMKDSVVNGYKLPNVTLYFNATTQTWSETAPEPPVEFVKIDETINHYADGEYFLTDLKFSFNTTQNMFYTNFGTPEAGYEDLGEKIYWTAYGETTKHSFNIVFGVNGNIRLMDHNTRYPTAYATITIEEGTVIEGKTLPRTILYVAADGKWVTEEPVRMAEFVKIDETINYYNDNGYRLTDLKFDFDTTNGVHYIYFGTEQSGYEGLKEKIYWTAYGETTKHSFSLVSGVNGNLRLWDAEANCPTPYSTVTIEEGTVIEGYTLPRVVLYVAEDGKWTQVEQTPPETPVATFVELKDNGAYPNSSYCVYLKFDKALRPTGDSYGYGTANQSGDLASKFTFNGATLTPFSDVNFYVNYVCTEDGEDSPYLEIFFVNDFQNTIKHADCLHIPEGTLFGEVQLGEVTLYFNAGTSAWQTEKPEPYVAGFVADMGAAIRIDSENGGLRFETHIEKTTYDLLVATYGKDNVKLGTYILPARYLELSGKSLYDYVTTYYNTVDVSYYLDISTWNDEQKGHGFANSNKNGEITDGNSYYKYYGTISKVKYENYAENFIGVGYLWVTDSEGQEYLYLTHDGSWSRNVYDVAKSAYEDTTNIRDSQLWGITPYFDKVIAISTDGSAENEFVYDIDSVLTARSYDYTKPNDYTVSVADGVITIVSRSNAVYNVMINGEKAGVIAASGTAYADYYAVDSKLFDTADEAKVLNFGFAEPNQELYGSLAVDGYEKIWSGQTNAGSTASNIAKVTAEFDGNSGRIWFQTADVCWPNSLEEFAFNAGAIETIKKVVADFRAQGVTNISLMASTPNYRSTKNYYDSTTDTWYNFWETLNGAQFYDKMSANIVVLPDEDDYAEYIALQKKYFGELAKELGNTITTIEILNEMEGASNYRFHYKNGYLPEMDLVAQAAMDICKAATDGIKEAGKDIKVMMPALMTVSELTSEGKVTRYNSEEFVTAEYDYIKSVGGNPDDYFQIINMHPYVTLSSDTSTTNYLYYENDGLTRQTPAQMQERWTTYMNSLREIFVKNGDAEKPVWITEFGLADYNGDCKDPIDTNKWSDYNDHKILRQAQVYQSIYDEMKKLPWLDTVLFFRLGDYAHTGEHNYVNCGEATYGVIDKNGNLKDFGKYLYAIVNGVNVFTDADYTSLKSLTELGTINGKTVDELKTNVEGIY